MRPISHRRAPQEQREVLAELQRQTRTALLEALHARDEPVGTLRRILAAASALQDEEEALLQQTAVSGPADPE